MWTSGGTPDMWGQPVPVAVAFTVAFTVAIATSDDEDGAPRLLATGPQSHQAIAIAFMASFLTPWVHQEVVPKTSKV